MGTLSSLIYVGVILAAVVTIAPTADAQNIACGKVSGDDADLANAWDALEAACPCQSAKATKWRKERSSFVKCARTFAADAVASGEIRSSCRNDLMRAAKKSTCSRTKASVTCCKTSHNGTKSCGVAKNEKKCKPNNRRFAEIGETDSCLDACENLAGPTCLVDQDCDDGNPCTDDACDGTGSCENVVDPFCDPSSGSGGSGGTSCTGKGNSTHGLSSMEMQLATLINNYRKKNASMSTCTSLSKAAQDHANDMRDKKYYSHKGKNGSEFWERTCDAGYNAGCGPSTWMGEIITGWAGTPEAAFQMWKGSPGHDALMKDTRYITMGIGHACGGPNGHYWVIDFGATDEASCN